MFRLSELLEFVKAEDTGTDWDTFVYAGPDFELTGVSPLSATQPDTVTWMHSQELDWSRLRARVVICARELAAPELPGVVFLPVKNPRLIFAKIVHRFLLPPREAGRTYIDPTARIGQGCHIGDGVTIGAYTVIGDHVTIGDRTEIRHHCVIADNTVIGSDCLIKSHVAIGEEGFGFELDEHGRPFPFPQLGRVVIGDHVQLGCFNTVDRAAMGETRIGNYVKTDEHVHIAHGVTIGENTLITACAEISGSATIGKGVWLGPNCSIMDKITIGDNVFVGLGAVVLKDVPANQVVAGNPARFLRERP